MGLPRWFSSKESACNADQGSIPGSGRSPGEKNGYPFQYSCLENSMDRGAWRVTVHGIAKSQTQLSMHTHILQYKIKSFFKKTYISRISLQYITRIICYDQVKFISGTEVWLTCFPSSRYKSSCGSLYHEHRLTVNKVENQKHG